jgi:hypothetical protein
MLFRETDAVYYENHTKYTNTLCGQNASFIILKQVVHIQPLGFKVLILLITFAKISDEVQGDVKATVNKTT